MSHERCQYAPDAYAARDPEALVRRYPFAQLITAGRSGLLATSVPIFFEEHGAGRSMVGHMARKNLQAEEMTGGQSALALFCGPHAYISASWYRERLTVPTWNYVSAQVRGTVEPIDDPAQQIAILRQTAALLENTNRPRWTLEDAPPGRVETLLPMIRSFRLHVERIEGVTKLSQTHPPGDRQRVIRNLLQRNDEGDVDVARWMAELAEPPVD